MRAAETVTRLTRRPVSSFRHSLYISTMAIAESDVYRLIGEEGFSRLVAAFYERVKTDDILRPLYPQNDLAGAEVRLRGFLIQRFGGPDEYSRQRGHPRLRMRHAPFKVDRVARDRWMQLMTAAMDACAISTDLRNVLEPYFVDTATFMINHAG